MFAFEEITPSDVPDMSEGYVKMINAYREGTISGWFKYFSQFKSYKGSPHLRRIYVGKVLDLSTNTMVVSTCPSIPSSETRLSLRQAGSEKASTSACQDHRGATAINSDRHVRAHGGGGGGGRGTMPG
jgi:hypothetical protein